MTRQRRAYLLPLFLALTSTALLAQNRDLADPAATIDRILAETWKKEGLEPSEPASDAELHRRLWLDVAGVVPSRAQTLAWLADGGTTKVDRMIGELLDSPEYARHWALVWQSVLVGRTGGQRGNGDTRLFEWLEEKVRTNEPYDRFAYELITADGYVPANFPPGQLAEVAAQYEGVEIDTGPSPIQYIAQFADKAFSPPTAVGSTTKVFLGLRIDCAECHDHPFEKWTQKDFQGMEAFFKRTSGRPLPNPPKVGEGTKQERRLVISYVSEDPAGGDARGRGFRMMMDGETPPELAQIEANIEEIESGLARNAYSGRDKTRAERDLARLKTQHERVLARFEEAKKKLLSNADAKDLVEAMSYEPKFLYDRTTTDEKKLGAEHLRDEYARLVTSNPDGQFARAIANRLWAHYFGRGIVHPLDDMRESNPPAIPELLEFLARLVVDRKYDLKAITKILLSTRAYRLSSIPNETNRDDEAFYSRKVMTPLTPEQTAFSLLRVRSESLYGRMDEGLDVLSRIVRQFVVALQDDEGTEVSDFSGTIPKSLFMMNSEQMNGLPDVGLDFEAEPLALLDQIYLTTLSRHPTPEEEFVIGNHLAATPPLPPDWYQALKRRNDGTLPPRLQAALDVYWALINSAEFTYNH